MSGPSKGARLYKYKHRREWYILDTGCKPRSTGCADRTDAEKVLAGYIANRGRQGVANEPANITCGEVLAIYGEEHAATVADPVRIGHAMSALIPFWGEMKLVNVKGETCRRYCKWRAKAGATMRRELGVLQAAINYAHREGFITSAPVVSLPSKTKSKDRYLTRDEAARLLWAAWRGHKSKHLVRFILIALYTGTRKDAVLRMGFSPNTVGGWFDLENRIMYRIGDAERTTNKRRTPAKIPRQLHAHLRRWHAKGARWGVEIDGARVGDIKHSFETATKRAGLSDVTPHTLKHTAITWALQNGSGLWDAAGFFATSVETIEKVYGHHSPDFQESALKAVEKRR